MDRIIFKINKNVLSAAIYKKDNKDEDLNNTNIINTKEIYFSNKYINENLELVSSFLNVIILKQNVNKIIIKDYNIILTCLDLVNLLPSIKELYIKPDKVLTYEMFLRILDNKYLESISAWDIPNYLLERLDINKKLNIEIRSEILFVSNFMESNKLNTYSDIFYKKNIIINKFTNDDKNDYLTFIKINKYLKVIEFDYFTKDLFEFIIDELIKQDLENIKIIFNEEFLNINDIFEVVNNYKNKYKDVLEIRNIVFKINYSEKYKKDNMFKQINLNFIKVSLLTIILTVSLMMGINIYHNYSDTKKSDIIENDLEELLKADTNRPNNITTQKIEYITPNENELDIINQTTTTIYDVKYDMVFEKLLAINSDTVGWLKVNDTNIDYPVVLGKDNEYYLKRDYYKNNNRHGWIFMDYRNNVDELSRNTIIYGHNLANQKMFGTLRYALNSAWYKKTSNQIITFNTTNENLKAQIFSIYKIPVTSDYLVTDFANDNEYMDFIKLIKERSIYDFKIEINEKDKILTLSTCSNGSEQRLVVHAKIIK